MDRLYRSRDDRMLAGVAGGLAEMWGADPSLVRVIWALLVVFTGGVALLVYIVMALVVPEEPLDFDRAAAAGEAATPEARAAAQAAHDARVAARRAAGGERGAFPASVILGGFLIILGGFFLAREFLPSIDFDWFWPLVLVGLGVLLVVTSMRRPSEPG
jgi:phage shock protein C